MDLALETKAVYAAELAAVHADSYGEPEVLAEFGDCNSASRGIVAAFSGMTDGDTGLDDELVITTSRHVHLLKPAPDGSRLIYVVLGRNRGTLAEARRAITRYVHRPAPSPTPSLRLVAGFATNDAAAPRAAAKHRAGAPTLPRRARTRFSGTHLPGCVPNRGGARLREAGSGADVVSRSPVLDRTWSTDMDVLQRLADGLRSLA